MRAYITILFIFSLQLLTHGQRRKNIQIPKYTNGDTSFYYKWNSERITRLNLQSLITSEDEFYFRLWKDGQIIEIWSADYKIFHGLLTNYTEKYVPDPGNQKKKKHPKFIFTKLSIDSSISKKIFQLWEKIESIPSEDSIKGWQQGFDGITYVMETSTPFAYHFKTYWTPTAQDSTLSEAKAIQNFVDNVTNIANLKIQHDSFFSTLKPGLYTTNHSTITRKLTLKEIEDRKKSKPDRDYMASISDSLDSYLSDTLTKLLFGYDKLPCYNEYILEFSSKNELIKISSVEDLTSKEDKKEFNVCKKEIIAAFKKIKVDFVHSKVPYRKTLSFYDKGVYVR